jgi:hypothetical protein
MVAMRSQAADAAASVAAVSADEVLERLAVFVISASLFGLALALLGWFVAPLVLALAALATWVYHRRVPASGLESAGGSRLTYAVPVLLVALALRLTPYAYVLGGQDQGVYMNVAAELVRTHDIAVVDPEFDRLTAAGAQLAYVGDNYTDPFLPGVYTSLEEKPQLSFQFYHLFPVWLALFAGVFGIGAAAYALTFLSLVSILFFQRLATGLTGNGRLGAVAGLLLALNPLHAFFSKFPVAENPTLAFSAMGFAFLAKYAATDGSGRHGRWLGLSAAAFLCLFLTRISGFMYLPLVLAISIGALVLDRDRARAHALSLWALATTAAYLASVAYGLIWSHPYSIKIYDQSFALVAGPSWPMLLFGGGAFVALAWAAVWRRPQGAVGRIVAWIVPRADRWLGVALLLLVLFGAFKAYQLGFTEKYAQHPWATQFPGVVGQGWSSLAHSSLVVVAIYLCPLLFAAFLLLSQFRWNTAGCYLLFFLVCFTAYAAVLNWMVPYGPYYARYFASELVPYALLLVVCGYAWTTSRSGRRVLAGLMLVSAIYSLSFCLAQIGKNENAGALESIARLADVADDGDVILLDDFLGQGFVPKEVKTTLVYTFGKHVVTVGSRSISDLGYLEALATSYEDVYLVSSAQSAPRGFVRVNSLRLSALGFGRSNWPPSTLVPVMDARVNIYRLDRPEFNLGSRKSVHLATDRQVQTQVGIRQPDIGIVSDGRPGLLIYGPYMRLPAGHYRLVVRGRDLPSTGTATWLEVVSGKGSNRLGRTVAQPGSSVSGGAIGVIEFEVPASGVQDLEVRVEVSKGSQTVIQDYTITRIQ